MDLRRLRIHDWVVAALGAGLLGSLFLDWYVAGVEGAYFDRSAGPPAFAGYADGVSAWEAFAVTDFVLAVAAAMAIGIGVLAAMHSTPAVPVVWTTLTAIVASFATLWLSVRSLSVPGDLFARDVGATVGPVLAWLLTLATWGAVRNDGPGRAPRREVEVEVLGSPAAPSGA